MPDNQIDKWSEVIGCYVLYYPCYKISLVFIGTCVDVWGTHMCECPPKTAAKDCSQVIDDPVRMEGAGIQTYLNTSLPSSTVFFPWYNGISVRTRAREGVLMHIVIAGNQHVIMEVRE